MVLILKYWILITMFINSVIANWLSGRAYKKLRDEKYAEAITIFNKIIKLDINNEKTNALHLFDIGYCYFKSNKYDDALSYFSDSYSIFRRKKNDLTIKPFYYLLVYYSFLLKIKGEADLSKEVCKEAKEFACHFDNGELPSIEDIKI